MNNPNDRGPTGTVKDAVKDKAHDLASSASHLAGDVKDKAQEWGSTVAQTAEKAWDSTKQGAERAWEGTKHGAQEVAQYAEDAWDNFGGFIRRYPVPSLFVALGVGFLLGGALGASSRRY